ncbi:MAG: type VI secretion system contractile sheath small subunit [Gammaproteobacteria bacterium]|nr:type VI secretion system contractile sheath small subunit [Gammaproteobacteria bacterium]
MPESTQHKLDRIRPPRVQITYDVEIGDAIVMKELPLVVGIMSDLSGKPEEPLPPMKERKFVDIDRDNFNEVLEAVAPRLAFRVDNKLTDDDTKLNVLLNFKDIDDFHPASLIHQVEPLHKLYEARQRLLDLLVKLDGNDDLDKMLQDIVTNTEELQKVNDLSAKSAQAGDAEGTAKEGAEEPAPTSDL